MNDPLKDDPDPLKDDPDFLKDDLDPLKDDPDPLKDDPDPPINCIKTPPKLPKKKRLQNFFP